MHKKNEKKSRRDPSLSRNSTKGSQHKPFVEFLIMHSAIDLRDNRTVIDLGNGYTKIEPIDREKRYGSSNPPDKDDFCDGGEV